MQNKEKIKTIIKNKYHDLDFKKIIVYRSFKDCNRIHLEHINGGKEGMIYGQRKKSKSGTLVRIAKVYINAMPLIMGLSVISWLDSLTAYVYGLLASVGLLSGLLLMVAIPITFWLSVLKVSYARESYPDKECAC